MPEQIPAKDDRPAGAIRVGFVADLALVYDAEIERDPDELVGLLAKLFETRRITLKQNSLQFVQDLQTVYCAEGTIDPEEDLRLLQLRLSEWREYSLKQMGKYLEELSLPDDDPLRCPISLFGTLGLGRLENVHSTALAWLLDPRQPHGMDAHLLDALLGHLAKSKAHSNVVVERIQAEHRVTLSGQDLGRMDIYGTGSWMTTNGSASRWLLAIEAKINASEGEGQLSRYDEWIDAQRGDSEIFRVFLTPEGRRPEAEVSDWTPLSFLDLVRVFREPYVRLREKPGFHFLRYYLTGVLMDICRWKLPVGTPESCNDPYGFVEYLKTVSISK